MRVKNRRKTVIRFLCLLCAAVLLFGSATAGFGPQRTITVSVPEAGAGLRLKDAVSTAAGSLLSIPYIADATMNELNGIIAFALGFDPTCGKALSAPGQNTKNNVAISILKVLRLIRFAYTLRFTLEPYADSENVFELCAYVRRLPRCGEERVSMGVLYDRANRSIRRIDGTGMMGIGYDFNYDFNTFSAGSDSWQRNFGFCRLYDCSAFLIGDVYETIRIPFRYGGKDWMIQIWKGVYSWNMLGGEIGLYNKPVKRCADFYDCVSDPDRMPMSFSVLLGDETIVQTDMSLTWWQTLFTQHALTKPRDLTMRFSITFPNENMLRAFRDSLLTQRPDVTIRTDGLTVNCLWQGCK